MAKFSYKKEDGIVVDIIPTPDEVGAAPKNVTLTDATASDTLPATTSTAITAILQTVRNALKSLVAFKTRSAGFATSAQGTKADAAIPASQKGVAGGVASLGTDGKVPSSQLPAYVDDVLEYANLAGFPATGESGKIYVAQDTNKTYRWSGSAYVVISDTLALGETSSTAYAGDKGKAATTAIGTLASLTTTVKTSLVNAINSLVTALGDKVDKVTGKQLSTEDYTTTEKTKLSGIATGANNYTHPTTTGNKHIPSGGSTGQILRWSADGTAAWGADNNTTYSTATPSANGLMSKEDKTKLDTLDTLNSATGNVYYATTATAINTAAKIVDGLPADYIPAKGDVLNLYMQLGNNVTTPTLSINGTSYALQFRDVNLTGSANYGIPAKQTIQVVFNGTNFQFLINPDWGDNDTTTQISLGGNVLQAGAAVNKYKLALEGIDGKFYEACTGDTNATTKTASTQTFKLRGNILFYTGSSAKAANGYFGSDAQLNYYYSSANLSFTFNGFAHCTSYRPLYLKGKVQTGGGFKLDATSTTSWYTTELPTSADGFIYIRVGAIGANNATVFTFMQEHPIFEFQNGHIRPYSPIKLSLSGSNLTITEE
ncbi:MAG: hypothetical protein LBG21_06320 [Campylobacteraceae bacterium]|jgi:hypothetical protein|nr:hypothetical protein [Campylobacteraceae bacterium]